MSADLAILMAQAAARRDAGQPPTIGDGHALRDWLTLAEADQAHALTLRAELVRITAICWEPK